MKISKLFAITLQLKSRLIIFIISFAYNLFLGFYLRDFLVFAPTLRVQDRAREIRSLQDNVLPKLKQQLSETKGVFKGKERKVLTEQIQQTETKISAMLDALPDILKEDGYPDVRAFMTAYREAEAVVEQLQP